MNRPLSPNAQAILLLTAPLLAGRTEYSSEVLTLNEYNRLARMLREKQCQPADLLGPRAVDFTVESGGVVGHERLERLLGRGFLLSQAVERWQARAIWIVSRADGNYPARLKTRLREDAPPVIYGCGELANLDTGGLAVVGSRHVDDELIQYTESVGRLSARARRTVLSGGARGIDQAAMRGALQAGGSVVGVLADSLDRAVLNRDYRDALMDGRLTLISPYDPAAGFNVGHAMQRNKVVYSLADAALVVSSNFESGGTWAGAVEQLERLHFVPIYVRSRGEIGKGLSALLQMGASKWPEPETPEAIADAFLPEVHRANGIAGQEDLFVGVSEDRKPLHDRIATPTLSETTPALPPAPAEELFATVRDIITRLKGAKTDSEIAVELQVSKSQVKEWLQRLVKEGALEKLSKPTRYRPATTSKRLV